MVTFLQSTASMSANSCSEDHDPEKGYYSKHAGRRRLRQWSVAHVAIVTTVAISLSSSVLLPGSSAYQACWLPISARRPKWHLSRNPGASHISIQRTALHVASTFLLDQPAGTEDPLSDPAENYLSSFVDDENIETTNSKPVRFRGITTTPSTAKKKGLSNVKVTSAQLSGNASSTINQSERRLSSTMPGFAAETNAQREYRERIRLAEQRTGKKMRETPEARRRRQKVNGESMYQKSKSVPDSLVSFAEEIHREDRISHDQEIELGEKTQEAIRLQLLFDNLEKRLNREPTDDEWCAAAGKINMEMIQQTIEEGLEAKNKLVTSNLRMVQSVVNTYIRNGLTAQYNAGDMMQEGIMALIRAAEKFEPERGWKFSTYAMYWVRASVKRSQIYQSRVIPVPPRLYENHKRLVRIEKELTLNLGRRPTKKEIGQVIGMSELQVQRCFKAMSQKCYSLDQAIQNTLKPNDRNKGGETLIDLVDSRIDDGEHNRLQRVFLRNDLIAALHRYLSPEEVDLLLLRYGLKDGSSNAGRPGRQLTIAELSRLSGINPDRCRRIIDKSIKQLQQSGGEEWLVFERELL